MKAWGTILDSPWICIQWRTQHFNFLSQVDRIIFIYEFEARNLNMFCFSFVHFLTILQIKHVRNLERLLFFDTWTTYHGLFEKRETWYFCEKFLEQIPWFYDNDDTNDILATWFCDNGKFQHLDILILNIDENIKSFMCRLPSPIIINQCTYSITQRQSEAFINAFLGTFLLVQSIVSLWGLNLHIYVSLCEYKLANDHNL